MIAVQEHHNCRPVAAIVSTCSMQAPNSPQAASRPRGNPSHLPNPAKPSKSVTVHRGGSSRGLDVKLADKPGRARHKTLHRQHHYPAKGWLYDAADPAGLPRDAANVAGYANGLYATTEHAIRRSGHHKHVLMIDVTGGDARQASALDIEPGDASPYQAAAWVRARVRDFPHSLARLYYPGSESAAVHASVASLPFKLREHVRYWLAQPTGSSHRAPGSNGTQYYWGSGFDLTEFSGDFMANT